jgi:biotin operon repressor
MSKSSAAKLTHSQKIQNLLNKKRDWVSVASIANQLRIPRDSVRKRVYDLRADGMRIDTTFKIVKGERKAYYKVS